MSLNLDKKTIAKIRTPLWFYASRYHDYLTSKDPEYVLNVIKKHPCFELIESMTYGETFLTPGLQEINENIIKIVFYDKFYGDPQCPQGIKQILFSYLGHCRYEIELLNGKHLLKFRYPYVEQWLNSVMQKNSP